jgi:hypothetical protein
MLGWLNFFITSVSFLLTKKDKQTQQKTIQKKIYAKKLIKDNTKGRVP